MFFIEFFFRVRNIRISVIQVRSGTAIDSYQTTDVNVSVCKLRCSAVACQVRRDRWSSHCWSFLFLLHETVLNKKPATSVFSFH